MAKKLVLTILFIMLAIPTAISAQGYTQRITPEISAAIKSYKAGNYTQCIQYIKLFYTNNPKEKNQLASYYLAMALTQAGDKTNALIMYNDVKKMNPNNTLGQYAQKGIVCIQTPDQCYTKIKTKTTATSQETELDRFINAPYGNGLSSNLNKEIERKKLEKLRKEMNLDEELNKYEFKDFKEYSIKKGQIENTIEGIKLASAKPTDAEVLNAIRVLNDAGLGNIAQYAQKQQDAQTQTTPEVAQPVKKEVTSAYKPDVTREEYQQQIQREMMQAQMAAMSQPNIGALFGEKNSNQNNMMNNNMMNMLPFMMAQQAQNGQQPAISPDIMQAMMFNQMMPNLDFSSGNNDR